MTFLLLYHPEVAHDVKRLGKVVRKRIEKAILSKLLNDPLRFGKPLQYSLKGGRSLRVGDHRVIYDLRGGEVRILAIVHRRDDYQGIGKRFLWRPR